MLGYTRGLERKYGKSVIDELDYMKHNVSKLSDFEGELLIKHFSEKTKEFKKQKVA